MVFYWVGGCEVWGCGMWGCEVGGCGDMGCDECMEGIGEGGGASNMCDK